MVVDRDSFAIEGLPVFLEQAERLKAILQRMSPGELQALWRCGDSIARLNVQRLKHMDLRRASDERAVRAELERLSACGILTRAQAQEADVRAVTRFGASALCQRLLSAQEMRREFRFTLLAEAADYFDAPAGERLLLQGVVDCFIVEDGRITVIDYKTDRVSADEAAARAQVYAAQLGAYAAALERIRKLPVHRKLVYFLTPGICCEV